MKGCISMSTKELERYEICCKIEAKQITQVQAANILIVSLRQVKRIYKNYKQHGAIGLISRKRGRKGNHRLKEEVIEEALKLLQKQYHGFGPALAQEKLTEVHKLQISVGTIRSLMIKNSLWEPSKSKRKRVFQLRERRACKGELVQMDGSPHDWFEGRSPKCTLCICVDDATGCWMQGRFMASETTWGYFDLMDGYIREHGKPLALYVDKHAVFRVNRSGSLSGTGVTDFGRAMQELHIHLIYANTPQAKGRVERVNRTIQDRLVKELRLRNISNMEEANAFLPTFIEDYNQRFAVVPKNPSNAHKTLESEKDLDLIFSIKEERTLSKNLMLQYNNIIYQIVDGSASHVLRKARVTILEDREGNIRIFYKKMELEFTPYKEQEKQNKPLDAKCLNTVLDALQKKPFKKTYRPSHNHPWRRSPHRKLRYQPQ